MPLRLAIVSLCIGLAACQAVKPGASLRHEQAVLDGTRLSLQVRSDYCFVDKGVGTEADARLWQVLERSLEQDARLVAVLVDCGKWEAAKQRLATDAGDLGAVLVPFDDSGRARRFPELDRATYLDSAARFFRDKDVQAEIESGQNRTRDMLADVGVILPSRLLSAKRATIVDSDTAGVYVRLEYERSAAFAVHSRVTFIGVTLHEGWPLAVHLNTEKGVENEIRSLDIVKQLINGIVGHFGEI